MYTLNSNIAALNAKNTSRLHANDLQESLRRLSSGLRINSTGDDVGGSVVANNLRAQVGATSAALKNINNAIGMFQTMDKAIDQQLKILDTVKAKAISAATDGQSQATRDALQKEVEELIKEFDNIANSTTFNKTKLLDGTFTNAKIQIGAFADDNLLDFSINSSESTKMGYVSYQTTYGGNRDIDNLQLKFKDSGLSGEDIELAPFTLSHTAGKSLKDLVAFVNKSTQETGVRAVYREGSPPKEHEEDAFAKAFKIQKRSLATKEIQSKPQIQNIQVQSLDFLKSQTPKFIQEDTKNYEIQKDKPLDIPLEFSDNNIIAKRSTIEPLELEDYNISYRSSSPKVLFPYGNKLYEDVSNGGTFDNSNIYFTLEDEKISTNFTSSMVSATINGTLVNANFVKIDDRTIRMNILGSVDGVTNTDIAQRVTLAFDPTMLQSQKQLDPADIILQYEALPRSRLVFMSSLKEGSVPGTVDGLVTLEVQGDKFRPSPNWQNLLKLPATSVATLTQPSVFSSERITYNISITGVDPHRAIDDFILATNNMNANMFEQGVTPVNVNDAHVIVDMLDPPTLALDPTKTFKESSDDNGYISTSIVLKLDGGKFVKGLSSNEISALLTIEDNAGVNVQGLAQDLLLNYQVNNDNELTVTFKRKAQNNDINLTGLSIVYNQGSGELFKDGIAPAVSPPPFEIEFLQTPTFIVSPAGFRESSLNNGTFPTSINITLPPGSPNTFSADVINQIDSISLPSGLTPKYERISERQIKVELEGSALDKSGRTIADFGFGFRKAAFTTQVNATVAVALEFVDSPSLTTNDVFKEDITTNNGSIGNAIVLTSTSDFAANFNDGDDVTGLFTNFSSLPPPLSPNFTILDKANRTIEMKLNGEATNNSIDIPNLSFVARGALFDNQIQSNIINAISIDFLPEAEIEVTGGLRESIINDGTVRSKVTFTLNNDTFVGTTEQINTGATISDLPNDLVPVFTKINATTVELEFTGAAVNHFSYDILPSLDVKFPQNLFGTANDEIVTQIETSFLDPTPSLPIAYGAFIESPKNDGSIDTEVGLTMPGGVNLKPSVRAEFEADSEKATRKYIKAYNLPYILTPVVSSDVDFPELLKIKLNGKALSNHAVDTGEFKLRFSPAMFVGNKLVDDASLPITFYDRPGLNVFGSFKESEFNDGSVDDEVVINVLGTTMNDVNIEDYITVSGLPSGLYPKFKKVNNSIVLKLDGNAQNHTEFDDVHDIRLSFDSGLFKNGMSPKDITNLSIDFKNKIALEVKGEFAENDLNDGSIGTSIIIKSDAVKISKNLPAPLASLITVTNLPFGLTPKYQILNQKEIKMTLVGNTFANDIADSTTITLSFDKDLYTSGIKPEDIEELPLTFKGAPLITYKGSFKEAFEDDGSIEGKMTFEVKDDVFNPLANFSDQIVTYNLPVGLKAKYELFDDTHLVMSLEGKAINSNNSNDVNNLSIQFTNKTLKKGVVPKDPISDLSIDFKDSPKIYVSTFFKESSDNDGSIENSIDLNLFGDKFTSLNPNDFIKTENVPAGLQAVFSRVSNSRLTMKLIGKAIDSTSSADAKDVIIKYKPELFAGGVAAVDTEKVYIDFKDRPVITPRGVMQENSFNDGSFSEKMILDITGDSLANITETNLNKYVKLESLPKGLTPFFRRINEQQLEMRFEGAALIHDKTIIKPTLIIDKKAFKNNLSPLETEITNIKFINNPELSIVNSFVESVKNDGSISTTISLISQGSEFSDVNLEDNIVMSNLPLGLTPHYIKKSHSLVEISLSGNAEKHTNRFDASNIKLDFSKLVFKSGIVAQAIDNISLNFRETPTLSTRSFIEAGVNDGSIESAVTLTITDELESFLDVDLDNLITTTNLPLGLKPKFYRLDDKNVKMTLEGKALQHKDEHDVTNVSLSFDSKVFQSGLQAEDIINMVVDFRDPLVPIFEVEESVFKENEENIGGVENSIDLILTGEDKIKTGITSATVAQYIDVDQTSLPAGLVPKFEVISNKLIKMSFTGKARDNNNENDTNIKLSFQAGLFQRDVKGKDLNDLKIDFKDPEISFQGSFIESLIDDGSIDNKVTIKLQGDIFKNGDYPNEITAAKLPLGLTPSYQRISPSEIEMSLNGRAQNHTNDFDLNDLKIKISSAIIQSGVVGYKPNQKVGVDFHDPLPVIQKAGGPGLYGGYVTFVSENARELSISAGADTANFGLDYKFKQTMNLNEVLLTSFDSRELFSTGIQKDPDLLTAQGSKISGLKNKHSALVFMDAVDSATKYLKTLRGNIASLQHRLQATSSRMLVERQNLQSAESNIREIDFAEETAQFQKRSLMAQAGNYMLSQANISQKMVLDLLKF